MSGIIMQQDRKSQPKGISPQETRTVTVAGRDTQLRLEPSYWEALEEICRRERVSLNELCGDLSRRLATQTRTGAGEGDRVSLANAARVFIVGYFRRAATETGHDRAGHGRGDPFAAGLDDGTPALRH